MMNDAYLQARQQRADGATLAAVYVVVLAVVPARLVLRGIPLSITPATVVALGTALCWLCAHFTPNLGMAKGRNPLRTGLYLLGVSLLATYGYATYHYLPDDEIKLADHSLVLIIALLGLALLICDGVRGRDRLDLVLRTMVVACTIIAVIGALQFVLDLDLTRYLTLPGLRFTSENDFIIERADFRRVAATTGHPIEFGVLCAMALPLALHYGFRASSRKEGAALWRGCSLLIAVGLLFSVSRSAVLGLVCSGVILLLAWPARRRVWALVVTVVFLGLTRIAVPGLLGTIFGLFANLSSDPSVQYRTHDYPIAGEEIAKSVWLGRGVGTFYAPKHIVFDNQYLLTLVEGGVIGFAAMVLLFGVGVVTALHTAIVTSDPERRDLALTLISCLVVPVIGAVTFDLLSFKTVTGMLFVLLGAIGCLHRIERGARPALVLPRHVHERS